MNANTTAMIKEESKTFDPGNEFPGLNNDSVKKEGGKMNIRSSTISEVYPISKVDRQRDRVFRNRIQNNTKYLKFKLKG
ncbi:MAG TPA: hypothetical protein VD908_20170 [Cytophagales bacterium]|nr:hypothetical protein [Cytophagales bacterium]